MNASQRQQLGAIADNMKALAADMRAFDPRRPAQVSEPQPPLFSIEQLARAVWSSDGVNRRLNKPMIANALEIALKTKVGLYCLSSEGAVHIDLGNGHTLVCHVQKVAP